MLRPFGKLRVNNSAQVQTKQKNQELCILVEVQNMILLTFFILYASFFVLLKVGYCQRFPILATFNSNYKTINYKADLFFKVYFSASYLAIFDFRFKI